YSKTLRRGNMRPESGPRHPPFVAAIRLSASKNLPKNCPKRVHLAAEISTAFDKASIRVRPRPGRPPEETNHGREIRQEQVRLYRKGLSGRRKNVARVQPPRSKERC